MRSRFDEQLTLLSRELIEMGALCEEVISMASRALMDGDATLARRVAPLDSEIDQKEHTIEGMCLRLLLQQQPVARDLRQISAALKMITDMERIGDQAEDIAEIVTFLNGRPAENGGLLQDMARAAIKMVTDSVDAYVRRDLRLAQDVIAEDDTVDRFFPSVEPRGKFDRPHPALKQSRCRVLRVFRARESDDRENSLRLKYFCYRHNIHLLIK